LRFRIGVPPEVAVTASGPGSGCLDQPGPGSYLAAAAGQIDRRVNDRLSSRLTPLLISTSRPRSRTTAILCKCTTPFATTATCKPLSEVCIDRELRPFCAQASASELSRQQPDGGDTPGVAVAPVALAAGIVPGAARSIVTLSAHAEVFGVGTTVIVGPMLVPASGTTGG
jgi:hypothetical protein